MKKGLVVVFVPIVVIMALWIWRSAYPKVRLDHKIVDVADGFVYANNLKQAIDKQSRLTAVFVQSIPNDRIDYIFEPMDAGAKYAVVVSIDNGRQLAVVSSYGEKSKESRRSLAGGSGVSFDFNAIKTNIPEIFAIAENNGGREFQKQRKPGDVQLDMILKPESGKLVWTMNYDASENGGSHDLRIVIDAATGALIDIPGQ